MAGKGKRAHVVKDGNSWKVKIEKQKTAAGTARTQKEAQDIARKLLEKAPNGGELIIHRPTGPIRDSDTIERKDPHPPKG